MGGLRRGPIEAGETLVWRLPVLAKPVWELGHRGVGWPGPSARPGWLGMAAFRSCVYPSPNILTPGPEGTIPCSDIPAGCTSCS